MHKELDTKIRELLECLRRRAPGDAVSFRLFVSADEHHIELDYRTPEGLKANCISMRNLAGEFIK